MNNKFTTSVKQKDISRAWHLVDMKDKVLGRTATQIAGLLMGKGKPYYVPNLDCGDYVVVINAKSVVVTGKKSEQKTYEHYSGYPGGRKLKTFRELINEKPDRIIVEAVSGMLPKNKLRDLWMKKLFVFPAGDHKYRSKFNNA